MKIVAFLQNPRFKEGTDPGLIFKYRDDQKFHKLELMRSMTGWRLFNAFQSLYWKIHWDNTNWRPAWYPSGKVEVDLAHMMNVFKEVKPQLVLCFGNQAKEAIKVVNSNAVLLPHPIDWGTIINADNMYCHHPNARHRTQQDLNDFADSVKQYITSKTT